MKKTVLFSCILVIFLTNIFLTNENIAYGHGFQYHCSSRDLRIEDETFLKQTIQKNESNVIYGKIVNLLDVKQEVAIGILLYENNLSQRVNFEISKILKTGYGGCIGLPYNGNPEFYFDVKPSFTQEITLQPNETKDYEIKITPLKSGVYHVHSAVYIGDLYRPAGGQTITVEGDFNLSEQELFKFYIPFYASVMLILLGGIFGIILLAKKLVNRIWIRNSKIVVIIWNTKKKIDTSFNKNQRKFIKIASIVICTGIIIQVFSFEKAIEYTTVMYPEFNGEKSWMVKFDSYHTLAIQVFISGISLAGIGLTVLILGIKRELILNKFLNFIGKTLSKISKRKFVESGILLMMIGVVLLGSSITLLLDQRCDNLNLGHNLCGVNPFTDQIISMLFLIFGIPLILGGFLMFIFGLKKKNPNNILKM